MNVVMARPAGRHRGVPFTTHQTPQGIQIEWPARRIGGT